MDRFFFVRVRRTVALLCACLASADVAAQNTTWTGSAGDGEWNTIANWSNGLPQAGAAVTFGPSSSSTIHAYPGVAAAPGTAPSLALASWSFPAGAPAYQLNLDSRLQSLGNSNFQQSVAYFDFTGAGISNQSGSAQAISMASGDLVTGNGGTNNTFNSTPATIRFFNTASAGTQMTYSVAGSARVLCYPDPQHQELFNRPDATIGFHNQSSAGSSSYLLGGGSGATAAGGTVNFYDISTAGNATFDLLGGVSGDNFTTLQHPINGYGGELLLHDQASAGTATVTLEPEANGSGGFGGQFVFYDQSIAGSAAITVKGTSTNGGSSDPGRLFFVNSANAGHSTIANAGSAVQSGFGGITKFDNTAAAGYAAISNLGSTGQFTIPSKTLFYSQSTADHATINNYASAAEGTAVAYGETDFYDTSSGANATITNYEASFAGQLIFHNKSTAANAVIHNGVNVPHGGAAAQTFLYDSSTLGTAVFDDATVDGGELQFHNASTASRPSDPQMLTHSTLALRGTGRFYDTASAANTVASLRAYGHLLFYNNTTMASMQLTMATQTYLYLTDNASAGQANITVSGDDPNGTFAPLLNFAGSSTLAQATVTLNGGPSNGMNAANGANLTFVDTSHPAFATIICNPGPSGGQGGNCFFQNTFTANEAPRLVANGGVSNGYFDFESQYNKSTAPVVGSIEGSGDFYLRGAALTVGSLNTNTVVAGRIIDDNIRSGGSLTKTGAGSLSLNGACTYTGATNVNQGTLSVGGNVLGGVNVASGAVLKGTGAVQDLVTVAAGGTVAPGNSPGTLTLGSASFDANAILEIECSDYATDHLVVTGGATLHGLVNVKILPGSSASAFEHEIITVGGTLDLSGLRIGSVPPGLSASNFSFVQNGGHIALHYGGSAGGSSYNFFEAVYFTPSQQADPSISGPGADPDHDGLTNGIEYALGLDPTQSSGSPLAAGSQASPILSGHPNVLTLSFSVPSTAPSGGALNVQQGTDLTSASSWTVIATRNSSGTWTTSNNASIVLGTAVNGRIPVTIIGSQPPPRAFMRLQVTMP